MTQALLITLTAILSGYTGVTSLPLSKYMSVKEIEPAAKISKTDQTEILWLARVIFSETKKEDEMELVGWVVRNRVEAKYRGSTYKEVALSANQFSGLDPKDEQYSININMDYNTKNEKWLKALEIANKIYFSNGETRPLPKNVLHFYSPVSAAKTPSWTKEGTLNKTIPDTNTSTPRFAFYSGVR